MAGSTRNAVTMAVLLLSMAAYAEPEIVQSGIAVAPASEPQRKAGDVVKALKNGEPWHMTLVNADGKSYSWKASDGCEWTAPAIYRAPSTSWENCEGRSGTATVRHESGSPWPMSVGTEWSFEHSGDSWQTDRDCEVEGTARVKVTHGEFDTFKIVCTDKWRTRTSYYAPSVGRSVYTENLHRIRLEKDIYEYAPD